MLTHDEPEFINILYNNNVFLEKYFWLASPLWALKT